MQSAYDRLQDWMQKARAPRAPRGISISTSAAELKQHSTGHLRKLETYHHKSWKHHGSEAEKHYAARRDGHGDYHTGQENHHRQCLDAVSRELKRRGESPQHVKITSPIKASKKRSMKKSAHDRVRDWMSAR